MTIFEKIFDNHRVKNENFKIPWNSAYLDSSLEKLSQKSDENRTKIRTENEKKIALEHKKSAVDSLHIQC